MAGEDPGVGILAFLLDFAQRAVSAVTGVFKGALNTVMDLTKTFMFLSWRRQMMQGQESDLKHGKQSLKSLRRHEDHAVHVVFAEIGGRKARYLSTAGMARSCKFNFMLQINKD